MSQRHKECYGEKYRDKGKGFDLLDVLESLHGNNFETKDINSKADKE